MSDALVDSKSKFIPTAPQQAKDLTLSEIFTKFS